MRYLIFFGAMIMASPVGAQGEPHWAVMQLTAAGVEVNDVETFQSLLLSELRVQSEKDAAQSEARCRDASCAQTAAKTLGAQVAVFGRLSRLGRKIIVDLTAVQVSDGQLKGSHRLTIDQIEDLETASTRFAKSFVEGTPIADGAELGAVTANEAQPDRRRDGDSGLSIKVGGSMPTAADIGSGVLLDLGYWFETRDFVIEPRLGFRWSVDQVDEAYFNMTAFDIFLSRIFSPSDFAPFAGFGAGLRGANQGIMRQFEVGSVVSLSGERLDEDSAWGLGVAARGGMLFLRTYSTRVALTVDYDVTFVDLNNQGAIQMFNLGLSVIF